MDELEDGKGKGAWGLEERGAGERFVRFYARGGLEIGMEIHANPFLGTLTSVLEVSCKIRWEPRERTRSEREAECDRNLVAGGSTCLSAPCFRRSHNIATPQN